jgi:hypothetical protein
MALTETDEMCSAVVPPPLCRDCAWCRPRWIVPPFPMAVGMWRSARCMHPTSWQQPPVDRVTGRAGKSYRLLCSSVRFSNYRDKCGPAGRYWTARAYPAWWWTAGTIAAAILFWVAYCGALVMIVRMISFHAPSGK